MDGKLVFSLSLMGLGIGTLSVVGVTSMKVGLPVEFWLWMTSAGISVYAIRKHAPGKFFRHGLLTGVLAGIYAPLIQLTMIKSYLANNPEYVEKIAALPLDLSPRMVVLLSLPFVAIAWGLFLGVVTWIGAKVFPRAKPTDA